MDKYTKELVKQLRLNNVNVSKVYRIISSFFGSVDKVPFTKRSLKTLCGKLSRELSDDDIRKTVEVFREIQVSDPGFTYTVKVDSESRVKSLISSFVHTCIVSGKSFVLPELQCSNCFRKK